MFVRSLRVGLTPYADDSESQGSTTPGQTLETIRGSLSARGLLWDVLVAFALFVAMEIATPVLPLVTTPRFVVDARCYFKNIWVSVPVKALP